MQLPLCRERAPDVNDAHKGNTWSAGCDRTGDGTTVRFTDGAFFPGEFNRLTLTFDREVFESGTDTVPLLAVAERLGGGFVQELEPRPRQGGQDQRELSFVSTGGSLSSFPGGDYVVTLRNVRSFDGGVLEEYDWGFSLRACGDGVCDADESQCSCTLDCGSCSGCCLVSGSAPGLVCRPGNTNAECGRNGQSCGVCLAPDQCAPDGAGCI